MADADRSHPGGTDVAALSAAVVAVSISTFLTPGDYEAISLVISVTVIALILGYVWPSVRSKMQSFALAAVVGVAAIPGIGFFDEAARSRAPLKYLTLTYEWNCPGGSDQGEQVSPDDVDQCDTAGQPQSRVPLRDVTIAWCVVVLLTFLADRRWQAKPRKP